MSEENDMELHSRLRHNVTDVHQISERQHENHIEYIPVQDDEYNSDSSQSKRRVTEIVNQIEKDAALMQDNPKSELLRIETLRDMPQSLTLKRHVKAKLSRSVSKKSKQKPLGFIKQCKYRISMTFVKFQMTIKDIFYSFELWYSALKSIEGYFGSGVATYFKFLRLLFISNLLITLPIIGFIIIPQFLYNISGATNNSEPFEVSNIITGEGYLSDTVLFYGHYTNKSVSIIPKLKYDIPYAYFFTMIVIYAITFIVFSTKMAKSYRHSFIETKGGLKNVYAHKVFCGWDYSIATKEGADLKATSIYNELKELLSSSKTELSRLPFLQKLQTFFLQASCHLIIFILLGVMGYVMWELLEKYNNTDKDDNKAIITSSVITIIMNFVPLLFTWIVKYERYKNPKTTLYISLFRTFLLEAIVIGVLLGYWLQNKQKNHCWETLFGQEIYRLILIDFLFTLLFVLIIEVLRFCIYKFLWSKIGIPEFDIARHTLQIIYNQTLFWMGLYFSPLLSVIVTIKFFITWYIKQIGCMYFSKPSTKSWRAAQTQTLFLAMTFFALLVVIVCIGFIITQVRTSSNCGPFQSHRHMYEILGTIFYMNDKFTRVIIYLTKPGVISGLLIAMSVYVYYLREKSMAQKEMVVLLQDMLVTEAKDKEFLLSKIGQITNGEWIYNLKRTFGRKELYSEQSSTWKFKGESFEIPSSSTHYMSEDEIGNISDNPRSLRSPLNSEHFEGATEIIPQDQIDPSDYRNSRQEHIVQHHRSESPPNVWEMNESNFSNDYNSNYIYNVVDDNEDIEENSVYEDCNPEFNFANNTIYVTPQINYNDNKLNNSNFDDFSNYGESNSNYHTELNNDYYNRNVQNANRMNYDLYYDRENSDKSVNEQPDYEQDNPYYDIEPKRNYYDRDLQNDRINYDPYYNRENTNKPVIEQLDYEQNNPSYNTEVKQDYSRDDYSDNKSYYDPYQNREITEQLSSAHPNSNENVPKPIKSNILRPYNKFSYLPSSLTTDPNQKNYMIMLKHSLNSFNKDRLTEDNPEKMNLPLPDY